MTSTLVQLAAIAAGGALGSVLRFTLSQGVHVLAGRGFPYGTLTVNILGCLLMGALFTLFVDRWSASMVWRAALLIGVLGGFTTFSSFSIETFNLIEQGELLKATVNVIGSVMLCLTATGFGVWLGRQV